jgi:hypothetical protein
MPFFLQRKLNLKTWMVILFQNLNLTLVLAFVSDFFIIRTAKGSAFPIKSTAGKSSADIIVTDNTPLTMTFLFFCFVVFPRSPTSLPLAPLLRAFFSKQVIVYSGSKGFLKLLSVPKGQYKSSKCT